jgi:TrkA domain protein
MSVYETDLPGVGRRFDLELSTGAVASVVIHHDGRCELYRREGDADAERLFRLTGDEANKLGSILEGAYFESVSLEDLSVPLGDAIIEWVELSEGSPLAGTPLRDTDIRGRTGATVVAVQRGEETSPKPNTDAATMIPPARPSAAS